MNQNHHATKSNTDFRSNNKIVKQKLNRQINKYREFRDFRVFFFPFFFWVGEIRKRKEIKSNLELKIKKETTN